MGDFLSLVISFFKLLATLATAYFGLQAIHGDTANPDGSLTRRGRIARRGVFISAAVAIALLFLEETRASRTAKAERKRLEEQTARQAETLDSAKSTINKLTTLLALGEKSFAQETLQLVRTGDVARRIEDNVRVQELILSEQQVAALEALRQRFPISQPKIAVSLTYPFTDRGLDTVGFNQYARTVRRNAEESIRKWSLLLRDSTSILRDERNLRDTSGEFYYSKEYGYLSVSEPSVPGRDSDRQPLTQIFGQHLDSGDPASARVDSVLLNDRSPWWATGPEKVYLNNLSLTLEVSRPVPLRTRLGLPLVDLRWQGKMPRDTTAAPPPRSATGTGQSWSVLTVDFTRNRIHRRVHTTLVSASLPTGHITSILDLPGCRLRMYVSSPAISVEGLELAFGEGQGRSVSIVRALKAELEPQYGGRWTARVFTDTFRVEDVAVSPDELKWLRATLSRGSACAAASRS